MSTLSLLQPSHLARFRDVAKLFARYGHGDLLNAPGLPPLDDAAGAGAHSEDDIRTGRHFAADLEKLGPTFIKLGQVLSTRADILPIEYLVALSRLQDSVEPIPLEDVEQVVSTELGVRLSKAFREFDETPTGSASLAQVHRAVTRSGREVAVKVQRPGIREQIVRDLDSLEEIAALLDKHTEIGERYEFCRLIAQFRTAMIEELDFRKEAASMTAIGARLRRRPGLTAPRPLESFTTSRVLTMDYLRGRKISSLSPLTELELDGGPLAEDLFDAYLCQVLDDGVFHADPHPGNILLTPDHRLAVIDFGMVGRIEERIQEQLLQLLLAISENRPDQAADIALKIGTKRDGFDEPGFRQAVTTLVGEHHDSTVERMETGRVVMLLTRACADARVRIPAEIAMLGKTLLNLDGVGRVVAPDFDPNAAIRRHAADLMHRRMRKALAPSHFVRTLFEVKELFEETPGRINDVLKALANNDLRVHVDAVDERKLITAFQKIANRITVGLVLAALIVGAALLMRVETDWKIFGYPGLAIILFLLAALGGFTLVWNVLFNDD